MIAGGKRRMALDAAKRPGIAADQPQLAAIALSKRFGGVRAVEDVTIAVRSGEIISIIGPNGAGKTSLLNMISGFYKPNGGSIVFEDRDITNARPSARFRTISDSLYARARRRPGVTMFWIFEARTLSTQPAKPPGPQSRTVPWGQVQGIPWPRSTAQKGPFARFQRGSPMISRT
jgi:ABC transporter